MDTATVKSVDLRHVLFYTLKKRRVIYVSIATRLLKRVTRSDLRVNVAHILFSEAINKTVYE